MRLDNSGFSAYMRCPKLYFERYEAIDFLGGKQDGLALGESAGNLRGDDSIRAGAPAADGGSGVPNLPAVLQPGIELDEPSEGRDFGTRMHELLHRRRLLLLQHGALPVDLSADREWPDEDIEAEAQSTLAAYEAHYVKDLAYLESERTHVLKLPERCPDCWAEGIKSATLFDTERWCLPCGRVFSVHELVVKLDAVVRHSDGTIGPFDTKTEGKPGYNDRESWSGKTQAKLYLFACAELYPGERVTRMIADIVTRRSPKQRRGPVFYRHDDISFAPEVIQDTVRNLISVADEIENSRRTGWWKSDTNQCKRGWEKCDFYPIHILGRTSENLKLYRPAIPYLEL